MARFYDPTYDPQKDSGTSGAEISDLNPEQLYDTDLRRVDEDVRGDLEINDKQDRVAKFMRAAKTAGKYKQSKGISEPTIKGRTPISKAEISGLELPSLRGRNYGPPGAGSTEYANKPKPQFGKSFSA
jgi:hypothetical protein|tara:strand:- start:562 stop:945 length:384 start_codon:yes stop_codon:yes gene_type:complete